MTQPDHLTEELFAQYRSRSLAPGRLLEVDEHLAHCDDCRGRLYRESRAEPQLRQLRADFSGHLEYDQIAACAHGSFPPEAARHLADCSMCRAEVDDLTQFRQELASVPRAPIEMPRRADGASHQAARTVWRLAVAAAVLLAAGMSLYLRQTQVAPPRLAVTPKSNLPAAPAEVPLTDDQKVVLQLAMESHKLERSPILDRVVTRPNVLMGPAPDAKGFELVDPMGTAVLIDRPVFSWKPAPGATGYMVQIFDENLEKVVESPNVTSSEWQPEHPLPRGRIYNWQVTAEIGGQKVHAPAPPAPEARFQVVSQEIADQIEAARRDHPANHTLLAALCAKAGAIEDARKELDQLATTDPSTAATLRESLKW